MKREWREATEGNPSETPPCMAAEPPALPHLCLHLPALQGDGAATRCCFFSSTRCINHILQLCLPQWREGIFNASAFIVVSLRYAAPGLYRPSRTIRNGTRSWHGFPCSHPPNLTPEGEEERGQCSPNKES